MSLNTHLYIMISWRACRKFTERIQLDIANSTFVAAQIAHN